MAQQLVFVAGERTPLMTAEAVAVLLRQSGFGVVSERSEGDEIEVTCAEGVTLWLFVENGFVVEIETQVAFANDRRSNRLLELIESMGWVPVDE